MSVRGTKALGASIDTVRDAERRRVHRGGHLLIPKQSVTKTKKQHRPLRQEELEKSDATGRQQVIDEQVELRQRKGRAWNQFNGRRGQTGNFSSVQIDGPVVKLGDLTPLGPGTKPMTGWQKLDHWHMLAAEFEEKSREEAERLGDHDDASEITAEVAVPDDGRTKSPGQKRRRFSVAYPT